MSASHARLACHEGRWLLADDGSTNGCKVNGRRVERAELADGDLLEIGRTVFRFRAGVPTPVNAPADADARDLKGMVAAFGTLSATLSRDLQSLQRVATSALCVLLHGETGTGKEVLARAIHVHSRRAGPFVAVNCGALPPSLVESLLFGHKKGAFSGAIGDEEGFIRAAQGGTLFLDEVGDLPAPAQAVLLRTLQEREVVPLGATRPVATDVRVIAATHHALPTLVESGRFRRDLYARLAEYVHEVPALRDRIDDIGMLLATLLPRVAGDRARSLSLSADAVRRMAEHRWPMNVRELEQRLKVSALLTDGHRIDLTVSDPPPAPDPPTPEQEALHRELIAQLVTHRGNLTQVAQAMGKARMQIHRWCRKFGVDPNAYRDGQ